MNEWMNEWMNKCYYSMAILDIAFDGGPFQ